ncbi:mechanosensitive ion channel protein MscS [Halostagnicola sp. A56]|uniref:mechanosensitive ion channel family protein n=1 Tax=Halostagnicola sp. A56 TaxID=1495067 RepID=UPI00049F2839|nr:mechanosensitive ion channel family protein [Halostagnicola sp. A56]KDE57471.1 mechanosensitive ion channel protein MscS [Halostagnicola sp. A56]
MLGERLWVGQQTAFEDFLGRLPDWNSDEFVTFGLDIAFACVIFGIGWYISKLAVRLTGRTVARQIDRPSVTRTVLRGVRASVLLVTLALIATIFGIGAGNIFFSVAVLSAIVGVVLAPLISSFINGVFILSDRPFEIGDMIEISDAGHRGFVEDITIRYTKIFTLENTFLVIPNSEIHRRDVINYSAEDERTRVSVAFDVTYESDLDAARHHAKRAARSIDTVISGGPDIRIGSARYGAAPICDILEFADHGVRLQVRFWTEHPYKQTIARSAVQDEIQRRFAKHDIDFAYPHTHHVFDETSGVARTTIESGYAREPISPPEGRQSDSRQPSDTGRPTDANPDSTGS